MTIDLAAFRGVSVDDLAAAIEAMPEKDRAALNKAAAPILQAPWIVQPGPQTDAYFSKADETLYGGAAGGGKTDLILGLGLTSHRRSVIFRRQSEDLQGIWERLMALSDGRRRSQNSVQRRCDMTDGRVIEMGHLEAPEAEKRWQGRPHDLIAFDEAAQLEENKVLFVLQWLRSTDPDQRCRAVFATNPPIPELKDGRWTDASVGDWLKRWFAPWLDTEHPNPAEPGELRWCYMVAVGEDQVTRWVDGPGWYDIETGEPGEEGSKTCAEAKSRTFIRSLVSDNIYLRDTGYAGRLSSTPEPLRTMLLEGQFGLKLSDHPMQVIPSAWVAAAQKRWRDRDLRLQQPGATRSPMLVIAADIAQGGMDSTTVARLYDDQAFARIERYPGSDTPDGHSVVERLLALRRNGALIVLDGGGGWGLSTRDNLRDHHDLHPEMFQPGNRSSLWTANGLYKFFNDRAVAWWTFREALDPDSEYEICLPPDDRLTAQLTAPHYGIDGKSIRIESKDELRKRLGSSTDEADAVLMAWHYRKKAAARHVDPERIPVAEGGWNPGMKAQKGMGAELVDPLSEWHE